MLTNLATFARNYADALDKGDAFLSGYFAHSIGITSTTNPYEGDKHQLFIDGWMDHQQACLDFDNGREAA